MSTCRMLVYACQMILIFYDFSANKAYFGGSKKLDLFLLAFFCQSRRGEIGMCYFSFRFYFYFAVICDV